MRHICVSAYNLVKVVLFVDTLSWWNRNKLWVPVLLTGNADDNHKLPPHRIGKCKSLHYFKNVKTSQKKYIASTNLWTTIRVCALYLRQLDKEKWVLKIKRFLPFINHCAAHSKNTFLRTRKAMFFPGDCTSQLQCLDVGIIHAFKCDT
jgi:hypothetical protein